jgi:hypothetical protein
LQLVAVNSLLMHVQVQLNKPLVANKLLLSNLLSKQLRELKR